MSSNRVAIAFLGTFALFACSGTGRDTSPPDLAAGTNAETEGAATLAAIRAEDVLTHVRILAADALEGRSARTDAGRRAARYVAERFEAFGLTPLGDVDASGAPTWFQDLADRELSPNVVAAVQGTRADGPIVVLGAHYDHLEPLADAEPGADRIFNGADDNASGTAALLEVAETLAAAGFRPPGTVVFVAFSAEELGLKGSWHFVDHAPFDLERVLLVINLDMVGRGREDLVFCEGSGRFPELRPLIERANAGLGLEIRFDEHPEWEHASDHWHFLERGRRALYFGVEDHPDYHQVTDHAERLLPVLTARVARLARNLAAELTRTP